MSTPSSPDTDSKVHNQFLSNDSQKSEISEPPKVAKDIRPTASHDNSEQRRLNLDVKPNDNTSPLHKLNPQLMNNQEDSNKT